MQGMGSCKTAVLRSLRNSILLFPTIQDYKAQQVSAEAPEIADLTQTWGNPKAMHQLMVASSSLDHSEVQQN